MLVPAMNHAEITSAIHSDLNKISETTLQRLVDEYAREREKFRIDKTIDFPRNYPIETASQNKWILFIQKQPEVRTFKTSNDAAWCAVVYYHSKEGLQAFRYEPGGNCMEVFHGHFFKRYNERLMLYLKHPDDIIEAFFTHNAYIHSFRKKEGNTTVVSGTCKQGETLGEWYGDVNWHVHKTFIN